MLSTLSGFNVLTAAAREQHRLQKERSSERLSQAKEAAGLTQNLHMNGYAGGAHKRPGRGYLADGAYRSVPVLFD